MAEEIYLNVRNFGAVGNGVQNDTVAVLDAISEVPSTGGTVYFPSGNYILTSPLLATDKPIYFIGEGMHTRLTFSGCNGIVIDNSTSEFKLPCGVIRLHLQTTSNGTHTALTFVGPDNTSLEQQITVRDIFISGVTYNMCWHTGMSFSHAAQSCLDNFMIRSNTNTIGQQSHGLMFDNVSTDFKVSNGSVSGCNIGCEVAGASESVILYASHFVACNIGIKADNMEGGHHFVLDQSHIAARTYGIILGNITTPQGPNHSHITDNFFLRYPSTTSYTGIALYSARNMVTGNEFTFNQVGQTEIGIHVQGHATAKAHMNMIANNLIFDADTAILLDTNSDRNMVVNNIGSNNTAGITDTGLNNTKTNNLLQQ